MTKTGRIYPNIEDIFSQYSGTFLIPRSVALAQMLVWQSSVWVLAMVLRDFVFKLLRSLSTPQSDAELEQGREEDAEREEQAEHHRSVVAMEEIDELAVVHLRQHVEHDKGHRVVDPVESHTGNDGVGAVVHPA